MRFNLTFKMDNAAFGEDESEQASEVARILRALARGLEETNGRHGNVRDVNGNRVGEWGISE